MLCLIFLNLMSIFFLILRIEFCLPWFFSKKKCSFENLRAEIYEGSRSSCVVIVFECIPDYCFQFYLSIPIFLVFWYLFVGLSFFFLSWKTPGTPKIAEFAYLYYTFTFFSLHWLMLYVFIWIRYFCLKAFNDKW